MNKKMVTRYCEKCGCELVSTNTHKLCDSCRRHGIEAAKKVALTVGGTAVAVFFAVKKGFFNGNKS